MNLVDWLSGERALLNIPVRTAPDATLALSRPAIIAISLSFLLLLPLLLVAGGAWVWWRRRRR